MGEYTSQDKTSSYLVSLFDIDLSAILNITAVAIYM